MENYNIVPLPPVVLYKDDLLELENLFKKNLNEENTDFDFTVDMKSNLSGKNYHSLDEIFAHEVPNSTDEFIMLANEKDENGEVVRGMRTTLTRHLVSYRYFSKDKEWYNNVGKQIKEFYKDKGPWYSVFSQGIIQMSFLFIFVALFIYPMAAKAENSTFMAFPALLVVFGSIMLGLGLTGKVFPRQRVYLVPKEEAKKGFELPVLVIGISTIAITIFSLLKFS